MRVDRLGLEDFRNYEREDTEFAPGLNLIVGANAQGKTNLLEAVHFLGGLGSPRSQDAVLVREGCERALLHADVSRGPRSVRLDMEIRPGRGTRALINGTPAPGFRALGELVVAVFFGPDDLLLVKGSPDARRRFLDESVVKLRPARDGIRKEWDRVLRQRNALLKSAPRSGPPESSARATLDVWDEAFGRAGATLTAARLDALAQLVPYAVKRYEAIAGSGRIDLRYSSSWLSEDLIDEALTNPGAVDEKTLFDCLMGAMAAVREREIERGMSLVGPQRDDIAVGLEAREQRGEVLDARSFASQGDQRTAALALKLAEYDLLSDALGDEPILLLDDVFSELDPSRRQWLAETVRGGGQTFMSSAEPGAVQSARPELVIEIAAGRMKTADA